MTDTTLDDGSVVSDEGITVEDAPQVQPSGIAVGLTPWGTVGINVTDSSGVTAGHVIDDPAEIWQLTGHLNSLATLMVQAKYAQILQEQKLAAEILKKPGLYVPSG